MRWVSSSILLLLAGVLSAGPTSAGSVSGVRVAANELPVAQAFTVATNPDEAIVIRLQGHDPDGDPVAYHLATAPASGSVVMLDPAAGLVEYTPGPGSQGAVDFDFYLSDAAGDGDHSTVTVNVQYACEDGIDNDGDGAIDFGGDPGCLAGTDPSECEADLICDDGLDNDGDGALDFPHDLGCKTADWPWGEDPACSDGIDNGDPDSLVDWDGGGVGDPDPGCAGWPWRKSEDAAQPCGLGPETALLLALAAALRRGRRRSCHRATKPYSAS